jgi:glycosyltransferase involved in cell wall biosynthesis
VRRIAIVPSTTERTVDVVIATHRTSPYLAEALASLRAQTYPRWRLILVDDGSGAPDQIDQLARAIPGSTVIHQANAGVAAARNRAIRAGEGDIVAFLDDDDRWPSDRLEHLVRALDRRPDALGAFGNGVYIDKDGRPFGTWHTDAATSEAFLRGDTPIPRITALVVVRDALVRCGLFDEKFTLAEDDELILRLLRHGAMASIGDVVAEYRRHDRNTTRVDWRVRHRAGRAAIRANIDDALARGESQNVALLRRNLRRYDMMTAGNSLGRSIGHLKAGSFRAAAADAWDSMRIAPVGFASGAVRTVVSKTRARLSSPRT